jgi:hypothetical protein
MAWENGRYIRKRWVGDTCISEYVGAGAIAELIAQRDQAERIKRIEQRKRDQQLIAESEARDDEFAAVDEAMRALFDAVMLTSGHYTRKRVWRKKRGT